MICGICLRFTNLSSGGLAYLVMNLAYAVAVSFEYFIWLGWNPRGSRLSIAFSSGSAALFRFMDSFLLFFAVYL